MKSLHSMVLGLLLPAFAASSAFSQVSVEESNLGKKIASKVQGSHIAIKDLPNFQDLLILDNATAQFDLKGQKYIFDRFDIVDASGKRLPRVGSNLTTPFGTSLDFIANHQIPVSAIVFEDQGRNAVEMKFYSDIESFTGAGEVYLHATALDDSGRAMRTSGCSNDSLSIETRDLLKAKGWQKPDAFYPWSGSLYLDPNNNRLIGSSISVTEGHACLAGTYLIKDDTLEVRDGNNVEFVNGVSFITVYKRLR